ncbi:MAG: pyridoxal 5'-phosphate synthase glutaminase subunit PdxT [archaeon]|nr:pyridoxal 5'-phosphate synthase glutaminase subunit PdxT [archaeon]
MVTVAVLALQGAFLEHEKVLTKLGVDHFEIRNSEDLKRPFDALIIPGGESTVMGKLLRELNLLEDLKKRIAEGLPAFGTCAGMIVLAKEVEGGVPALPAMDIKVLRNAYGRQLGSFYANEDFADLGKVPMTFIRAPCIESVSGNAEVLAVVDGRIVAARDGKLLAVAFHPEITDSTAIHEYFLRTVAGLNY